MPNMPARTKITTAKDIANGCGLGVSIESLKVKKVLMSTDIINAAVPVEENRISAPFSVTFTFAAGYSINADYVLNMNVSSLDLTGLQYRTKAIQNDASKILIEHDHGEPFPFNNWFLLTDDTELLEEVKSASCESPTCEMIAGEEVVFYNEQACFDVALSLETNLDITKTVFPETGFTKEFVTAFDKRLRDEICAVLVSAHDRKIMSLTSQGLTTSTGKQPQAQIVS